jgi:hypothetical protein
VIAGKVGHRDGRERKLRCRSAGGSRIEGMPRVGIAARSVFMMACRRGPQVADSALHRLDDVRVQSCRSAPRRAVARAAAWYVELLE